MQISGIGFQPYIYNTNAVSSASMNKISSIGSDVSSQKTDFSPLSESSSNENPLKMGESKNFMDILSSQMSMSQMNATRVMDFNQSESSLNTSDNQSSQQNDPYSIGMQQSSFDFSA